MVDTVDGHTSVTGWCVGKMFGEDMEHGEFIELVEEILEVRPGTVSLTSDLVDIDWDSLANISFIAAVDERFGVTLDAERLAACTTPGDLLELVNTAKAA